MKKDDKPTEQDKVFMKRCIELAEKSLEKGDNPFGCVITKNNKIIAESLNESKKRVSDHAEVMALNKAHKVLGSSNLSSCTLYSNCEPCPMCAFMMREFKIGKVVFALSSPYVGGYTRWNILDDKVIGRFNPFFSKPPVIIKGILKKEAKKILKKVKLRYRWAFR